MNGNEVGGIAEGSAIAITLENESESVIKLRDLNVEGNTASLAESRALLGGVTGGAVSIHGVFHLVLEGSAFEGNVAWSTTGVAHGGALSLRWEQRKAVKPIVTVVVADTSFVGNSVSGAAASGGAIFSDHVFSSILMDRVTFRANSANASKCARFASCSGCPFVFFQS